MKKNFWGKLSVLFFVLTLGVSVGYFNLKQVSAATITGTANYLSTFVVNENLSNPVASTEVAVTSFANGAAVYSDLSQNKFKSIPAYFSGADYVALPNARHAVTSVLADSTNGIAADDLYKFTVSGDATALLMWHLSCTVPAWVTDGGNYVATEHYVLIDGGDAYRVYTKNVTSGENYYLGLTSPNGEGEFGNPVINNEERMFLFAIAAPIPAENPIAPASQNLLTKVEIDNDLEIAGVDKEITFGTPLINDSTYYYYMGAVNATNPMPLASANVIVTLGANATSSTAMVDKTYNSIRIYVETAAETFTYIFSYNPISEYEKLDGRYIVNAYSESRLEPHTINCISLYDGVSIYADYPKWSIESIPYDYNGAEFLQMDHDDTTSVYTLSARDLSTLVAMVDLQDQEVFEEWNGGENGDAYTDTSGIVVVSTGDLVTPTKLFKIYSRELLANEPFTNLNVPRDIANQIIFAVKDNEDIDNRVFLYEQFEAVDGTTGLPYGWKADINTTDNQNLATPTVFHHQVHNGIKYNGTSAEDGEISVTYDEDNTAIVFEDNNNQNGTDSKFAYINKSFSNQIGKFKFSAEVKIDNTIDNVYDMKWLRFWLTDGPLNIYTGDVNYGNVATEAYVHNNTTNSAKKTAKAGLFARQKGAAESTTLIKDGVSTTNPVIPRGVWFTLNYDVDIPAQTYKVTITWEEMVDLEPTIIEYTTGNLTFRNPQTKINNLLIGTGANGKNLFSVKNLIIEPAEYDVITNMTVNNGVSVVNSFGDTFDGLTSDYFCALNTDNEVMELNVATNLDYTTDGVLGNFTVASNGNIINHSVVGAYDESSPCPYSFAIADNVLVSTPTDTGKVYKFEATPPGEGHGYMWLRIYTKIKGASDDTYVLYAEYKIWCYANTDNLNALVTHCEGLVESNYTTASWDIWEADGSGYVPTAKNICQAYTHDYYNVTNTYNEILNAVSQLETIVEVTRTENGTIDYNGTNIVPLQSPDDGTGFVIDCGTDATFTFTPNTGYQVSEIRVTLDGETSVVTGTPIEGTDNQTITISTIMLPRTVTATFEKKSYTIAEGVCSNGSITATDSLLYNSIITAEDISISPDNGYQLVENSLYYMLASDETHYPITLGTTTMPAGNITIYCQFEAINYAITFTSGTGYTITATKNSETAGAFASGQTVTVEDTLVFSIAAAEGYTAGALQASGENNHYTFDDNTLTGVYEAVTISGSATIKNYTVSVEAPTKGTLVCTSPLDFGTVLTATSITATADAGYSLDTLYYVLAGDETQYPITLGTTTMPANNITVYATFVANTDTAYVIKFYQQNIEDDNYVYVESDTLAKTGTTDTITNYNVGDDNIETDKYTGFTFGSIANATITGNGNASVKVYYIRLTYVVAITANANGSVNEASGTYRHGKQLLITATANTGYSFEKWSDEDTTNSRTLTITSAVTLSAIFVANTNTAYIIKFYQQNLADDEYTYVGSDDDLAKTGTTATTTTHSVGESGIETDKYTGFTFGSITNAIISGDGTTVVNVYYTRNSYTITFVIDSNKSSTAGSEQTLKYGAQLVAPEVTAKNGYSFNNWNVEIPAKATQTVAYTAQFTTNTYVITFASGTGYTITATKNSETFESGSTVTVEDTLVFSIVATEGYTAGALQASGENNHYTFDDNTLTGVYEAVTISGSATLIPATEPTISAEPVGGTTSYKAGKVLSVTVDTVAGHTPSYQWFSNSTNSTEGGVAITGGTGNSYTTATNINAGTTTYYYCVVTLTRGDNEQTASKTSSIVSVEVVKAKLTKPTADLTEFTYNRYEQTYNPVNFDDATMAIENATQTDANTTGYTVTVSITDTTNYEWAGEEPSIEDLEFTFVIAKDKLTKPTADLTEFAYDGSQKIYRPVGFDSSTMTIANVTQTDANTTGYTVTVSITDTTNYEWTVGGTDSINFTFVIAKATPSITTAPTRNSLYVGQTYGDIILNNDGIASVDGEFSLEFGEGKTASSLLAVTQTLTLKFTPTSSNYEEVTRDYVVTAEYLVVTFYEEDGESVLGTDDEVTYNGTAIYPNSTPTKELDDGYTYTFNKWVTTAGGTTEATLTDITANAAVYASYSIVTNSYSITASVPTNGTLVCTSPLDFGTVLTATNITATADDGYALDNLYYVLAGDEEETHHTITLGTTTMPADNITVYATFVANTDTAYVIKFYQQNLADDEYTYVGSESDLAKTGTTATTTTHAVGEEGIKTDKYVGFTFASITNATITGDGNAVVNVYYNRLTYVVTITANANGSVNEASGTYRHGKQLQITATANTGYSFEKWSDEDTTNPRTITITSAVTLSAIFVANTNTVYTVKHWMESLVQVEGADRVQVDGIWYEVAETDNTDSLTGTTGGNTVAEANTYTGFTAPDSITQLAISGDGTTVVNVYYTRNSYTITFVIDSNKSSTAGSEQTLKYGAQLVAPEVTAKNGYSFNNWNVEIPATATQTVTYTAQFTTSTYVITFASGIGYTITATKNSETFKSGSTVTVEDTLVFSIAAAEGYTAGALQASGTNNYYTFAANTLTGVYEAVTISGSATIKNYTVSVEAPTNGTLVCTSPLGFGTVLTATNITATADDGYALDNLYYVLAGDEEETHHTITLGTTTMPADDITVYATFVANTDTAYVIKFYQQNLADDEYTYVGSESDLAKTGTTATTTIHAVGEEGIKTDKYVGFTFASITNATITGDGNAVVNVYYDRLTYVVTITANANGSVNEVSGTYRYGKQLQITATADAGYSFEKWSDEDATNPRTLTITSAVTLSASFVASTNADYTVKHWMESLVQVEGANKVQFGGIWYEVAETDNTDSLTGTTGENTAAEANTYIGFTAPDSITQLVISGDGTTVVNVYYTRNSYTITYKKLVADAEPYTTQNYKYGASISAPVVAPTRAGYQFGEWTNLPSTMPAESKTILASWSANTNTVYTIEFYKQNLADNEYTYVGADADISKMGTTDTTTVHAVDEDGIENDKYENFVFARIENTVIAADGEAVVKVYYDLVKITITWDVAGTTSTTQVKFGGMPSYSGTPTKANSATHRFTFSNWSPAISVATGNITYTAQFNSLLIKIETPEELPAGQIKAEIEIPNGVEEDTTLVVSMSQEATDPDITIPANKQALATYNASLRNSENEVVEISSSMGTMNVKIYINDDIKNKGALQVAVVKDGRTELIDATVDGNYLSFSTTDLGDFTIVAEQSSEGLPIVLIAGVGGGVLLILIIVVVIIIVSKKKKKPGKVLDNWKL